jgi:transposase-like protein
MAERGVHVDHSTIARWVLHFSPMLHDLIRRCGFRRCGWTVPTRCE